MKAFSEATINNLIVGTMKKAYKYDRVEKRKVLSEYNISFFVDLEGYEMIKIIGVSSDYFPMEIKKAIFHGDDPELWKMRVRSLMNVQEGDLLEILDNGYVRFSQFFRVGGRAHLENPKIKERQIQKAFYLMEKTNCLPSGIEKTCTKPETQETLPPEVSP